MARPFGTYKYTPEELMKESKAYFDYCDNPDNAIENLYGKKVRKPKSIAGLASWLGVCKTYLADKAKEKDYSEMIGYIRQEIENDIAEGAMVGLYNPTTAVKNLSANFDWKDKSEIDQKTEMTVNGIKAINIQVGNE